MSKQENYSNQNKGNDSGLVVKKKKKSLFEWVSKCIFMFSLNFGKYSKCLAADEARVSHALSHVVW